MSAEIQEIANVGTDKIAGKLVKDKRYKAIGYIYVSYDYDMFKILVGNREFRPGHIKNLIESFEQKQLISAVIVNENYEIIDGQHRFMAAKATNGPVYFIIAEGYGLPEVQTYNTNSKDWHNDEHMHSYCARGIQDYIVYRDFKIQYSFGHQETLALLLGSTANFSKVFKDGYLKINSVDKAVDVANMLLDFKQLYKGFKRKSFVYAYIELVNNVKGFNHKEMLKKVSLRPTELVDCTTKESYLVLLENMYNYHRAKTAQLRFR